MTPTAAITAIRAALHNVFLCEWRNANGFIVVGPEPHYEPIADTELDTGAMAENAAYIASANPAAITELLGALDAQAAEIQRLRSALLIGHTYAECCPTPASPDDRDADCAACVALGPNAKLTGQGGA